MLSAPTRSCFHVWVGLGHPPFSPTWRGIKILELREIINLASRASAWRRPGRLLRCLSVCAEVHKQRAGRGALAKGTHAADLEPGVDVQCVDGRALLPEFGRKAQRHLQPCGPQLWDTRGRCVYVVLGGGGRNSAPWSQLKRTTSSRPGDRSPRGKGRTRGTLKV